MGQPRNTLRSNFLSQAWLLSRRRVLRGLGVSLALPLLDCMRSLHAADFAPKPRRSVFVYLPNGVNTLGYQITEAGADYTFSKPLEKHRASITPISGLHHLNGLGHHHNCSNSLQTDFQPENTFTGRVDPNHQYCPA